MACIDHTHPQCDVLFLPGLRRSLHGLVLAGLVFSSPGCTNSDNQDDDAQTTGTPSPTPEPSPEPTPVPSFDWTAHAADLMDFWSNANIDDTEIGGYYSGVQRDGTVFMTDKWTRSVSRQVYGHTRAFQLTGDLHQLDLARSGLDFLINYAHDNQYGGFRKRLTADGTVVENERDMFDQVYALAGIAAYFEATHDPEVESLLTGSYSLLSERAWDSDFGGYYKALNEEMTVTHPETDTKTQLETGSHRQPRAAEDGSDDGKEFNSLVDTATAYLFSLYAATGLQDYSDRLNAIGMNIVGNLIVDDGTGWIGENFDRQWTYDPSGTDFGGDTTLCGHNLKTVWTLLRIYLINGTELFKTEAETLLTHTLTTCRDSEFGGIYDQVDRQTSTILNPDQKAWWQQEQGMFANQLMAAVTGKSYYSRVHEEIRDFYLAHFPDAEFGEVYGTVSADGTALDTTKGNEWKSAYHSVETAYFSHLYESFFTTGKAVTLYYYFDAFADDRTIRLSPAALPYGVYDIDDPATLDGEAIALNTPSTILIPAESSGTLTVVYRPTGF